MLKIRNVQLASLKKSRRIQFIIEMAHHLRTHFPEAMNSYNEAQLHEHIGRALHNAEGFGITNKKYTCKFLNLCAIYGWKFFEEPENQWMRVKYLENPSITSPESRLDLLTNQCLWRMEAEEHNKKLRKELGEAHRRTGTGNGEHSVPLMEKDGTKA